MYKSRRGELLLTPRELKGCDTSRRIKIRKWLVPLILIRSTYEATFKNGVLGAINKFLCKTD